MDLDEEMAGFRCRGCGECCRIAGQVRLTDRDIQRLSVFLGLTEHEFIQRHADLACDRRGLVLQGNPEQPCRFLEGDRCAVYPVRPEQCATYPTAWRNPGWAALCRPMQ